MLDHVPRDGGSGARSSRAAPTAPTGPTSRRHGYFSAIGADSGTPPPPPPPPPPPRPPPVDSGADTSRTRAPPSPTRASATDTGSEPLLPFGATCAASGRVRVVAVHRKGHRRTCVPVLRHDCDGPATHRCIAAAAGVGSLHVCLRGTSTCGAPIDRTGAPSTRPIAGETPGARSAGRAATRSVHTAPWTLAVLGCGPPSKALPAVNSSAPEGTHRRRRRYGLGHPDATYGEFLANAHARAARRARRGCFVITPSRRPAGVRLRRPGSRGYLKRLPSARHVVIDHGPIQRPQGSADLSPASIRLDAGDYARAVPLQNHRRTGLTALHLDASVSPREPPSLAKLTALTALTLRKQKLPSGPRRKPRAALRPSRRSPCSAASSTRWPLCVTATLTELEILGCRRGATDLDTRPRSRRFARSRSRFPKLTASTESPALGLTSWAFTARQWCLVGAALGARTALQSLTLRRAPSSATAPPRSRRSRASRRSTSGRFRGVTILAPCVRPRAHAPADERRGDLTPAHFAVLAGHPTLAVPTSPSGGATKNKACNMGPLEPSPPA